MLKSKPPGRSTAGRGRRLRPGLQATAALALPLAFVAFGASAWPAGAAPPKRGPLKVLVAAPVSDSARGTITEALWTKYVSAYVGDGVVPSPPDLSEPTLADCRRTGADYLVMAPFELRPRLPGMPNSGGRVAARAHVVVTNCITGTTLSDRYINFDSDLPSDDTAGDYETVPEMSWGHSVPAALARFPIVFGRIAQITHVSGPFALVDLKASSRVAVGDRLRDFATPERTSRAQPIVLTVTQVFTKYAQATFSTVSGETPSVGDYVEPLNAPDSAASTH